MRTKSLILAAALGVAGALSGSAQSTNVYSVNAVGYVQVTVPAGAFLLVANPLNQGTNILDYLLPDAPINTTKVFDYDPISAGFLIYTKRLAGWGAGAAVLFPPGKGFFVQNTATTNITLTFVGEVPQGTSTINFAPGFNLISAQFPLAGKVETDLGFPAINNDVVYKFDPISQGYGIFTRRAAAWGGGNEPSLGVAEGFFLQTARTASWVKTFSANN